MRKRAFMQIKRQEDALCHRKVAMVDNSYPALDRSDEQERKNSQSSDSATRGRGAW
ncbi:MAG: hypothetical protein RL117_1563 [Verrucomicrobiota bacterium]